MKSDTPDELFVFPDQVPVCPTAQILESELIFQNSGSSRALYDRYIYGFPEFQSKISCDDLPF